MFIFSIIAYMVLSIISALFCIPLIVFAGIGFADAYVVPRIFYAVQILIALVQGVVATLTSAYSCRVVCCGKNPNHGQVLFSPTNAPPQIIANPIIRPPSPHYLTNQNPPPPPPRYCSAITFPSPAEENPGT